jgi:predicted DNA binding CopG/RHH family protein
MEAITKTKAVLARVQAELHTEVKVAAAQEGISVQEFTTQALLAKLANRRPGRRDDGPDRPNCSAA